MGDGQGGRHPCQRCVGRKRPPKRVLALPDLEQSKAAVRLGEDAERLRPGRPILVNPKLAMVLTSRLRADMFAVGS